MGHPSLALASPAKRWWMILVLIFLDTFLTSDPPCGFKEKRREGYCLDLPLSNKGPAKRARVPQISFPLIPLI
jgi:hypothetical protein